MQVFHVVGMNAGLAGIEEVEQRPEVDGFDIGKVNGGDDVDDRNFFK